MVENYCDAKSDTKSDDIYSQFVPPQREEKLTYFSWLKNKRMRNKIWSTDC